jgi:uncharacterized protein YaiE (UPF0345 family)
MNKLLVIPVLAFCLNSCIDGASEDKDEKKEASTVNVLSDEEKKDGWQLLFDGTSTKGWHKYGDTATGSAWKIDSGTLHLDASQKENWQIKGGGDIVTNDEYDNFDLKLEWKIDTCGNSGIIIFIKEDTAKYTWGWQTGPEMQVLDNRCHPDTAYITHRAGSLYDLMTVSKVTVKPALEWNQVEIKSLNGKLDFWLNGENVVSTTMWDDNWKKMIAGSKFKAHPDFGTIKKGKLGLQDHGNNVWFRNIKIKKL